MSDMKETSKEKAKKAPVLDWTPPSYKKGSPKYIEDTAAYPKTSQDSRYAATTPLNRKQTPEGTQEKERVRGPWERRWLATRNHLRRYWYWYVPLAIVLLAVALVILFLVIIPAIAQLVVDKAALPVHAAALGNPSENSTQFSLVTSIKIPAGLSANLMPINLSLSGETDKTPYAKVSLPKYHLKGTTTITITNQTAAITNMDSYVNFLKTAMYQRNFTLHAHGKTNVYLGKLKSSVTLNKDMELPGLQNLTGFGLTSAKIVLPAEADGTNLVGNASIPNYSIIKLELGNMTMNMLMGGFNVGTATLSNVNLLPGNNTLPIRAALDLKTILANIGPILASQTSALKNGTLAIQSSGNSTVYNGQHLTYYEDVLNPLTITAYVPIKTILSGNLAGLVNSTDAVVAKLGQLASNIDL